MITHYKPLFAVAILVVLAGCQTQPKQQVASAPVVQKTVNIDGQWRATEGPILATFSGKDFKSVNVENNQVVAAGAFKINSATSIRLDWVGALSGRSSANCSLVNDNILNCVPSNGSGFQLRRI